MIQEKKWTILLEFNDGWVAVAEVSAATWHEAVQLYRDKYMDFLNAVSNGYGDTVNLEAEEAGVTQR